jgi:hypothetical protein
VAIRVADGTADIPPDMLRQLLTDVLIDGGVLFVVPAAERGAANRGYAFVLGNGQAEGLSASDAAAAFQDEAPEDWTAAPTDWKDAPPLDHDPAAH